MKIPVLQSKRTVCRHRQAYLSKLAYGSVDMVSVLRSERPRIRFPGGARELVFSEKSVDVLEKNGSSTFSFCGYKRFFPPGDAAGA